MVRISYVKCGLFSVMVVWLSLLVCGTTAAQETDLDPNRIFTTDLHWDRVVGAPRSETLRQADGTLMILYREGLYAEVTASFTKNGNKVPIDLNLNQAFVVHLGTWNRTEDDTLIHIQSREVMRYKITQNEVCRTAENGTACSPTPELTLPGPVLRNTCRLERPSSTHIADAIVCTGLTVFHSHRAMDLAEFPSIVRGLVQKQKSETKPAIKQ